MRNRLTFQKLMRIKKKEIEDFFTGEFKNNKTFKRGFNLKNLFFVTKVIIKNLNKVIDRNYYPKEGMRKSNFKMRPVGLGVQGLADVFALMGIPFESELGRKVNKYIFETIHYAALEASCELSKLDGPYKKYEGSPISQGILCPDLWNTTPELYDWTPLREKIKKYGVRNSLLIALMPTATTSQVIGFNECFEPYTSNIYIRRTGLGEFQILNKYLMSELELNLWNSEIRNLMLQEDGSIQKIPGIP